MALGEATETGVAMPVQFLSPGKTAFHRFLASFIKRFMLPPVWFAGCSSDAAYGGQIQHDAGTDMLYERLGLRA